MSEYTSGIADAASEFAIMLGCPQCRAEQYLTTKRGTPGCYGNGWRMAAQMILREPHECNHREGKGRM